MGCLGPENIAGGSDLGGTGEGVFAPPLVEQSRGTHLAGLGTQGAQVAVHQRTGVVEIDLCGIDGIEIFARPDVPGPENGVAGVHRSDEGVAVLHRIGDFEVDAVLAFRKPDFPDDASFLRRFRGVEGLP